MCYRGVTVFIIAAILKMVAGHGRLLEPPSRSSMWRSGFDTPKNYNDNQLFCGGFATQYGKNGGKCGVCGDRWDSTRENEGTGKYSTGTMAMSYETGQVIETLVDITANHKGWFQFKLCKNDIPQAVVEQSCFDQHILANEAGETKLQIGIMPGKYKHRLRLPQGLRCKACVLQWRYHTANSWGTDKDTGQGCIGCGDQEEFYGCSDIVIGHPEVEIGEANKPQHLPPPSGPGDGQIPWNDTQGQNNPSNCNCPCAFGSASFVNPVNTVCWFACVILLYVCSFLF